MNQRQEYFQSIALSFLLLVGLSMTTLAEAAESTEDDRYVVAEDYTMVVTANRIPMKETETAANVTVITREEIEKGGYTSVPEILDQGNVVLETDSSGSTPVLNGDHRVLILVDGRRMNWDYIVKSGSKGGIDLENLPVENIERIEIVHGPASSLYGSDAVGGVINIITRKPANPSVSFIQENGSWGMRRYSLSAENYLDNGWGFYVTAESKKQNDYKYKEAGTGESKTFDRSYYDRQSFSARVDKALNGDNSLSLQFDHAENDYGFTFTGPGYSSDDMYYYPDGFGTSVDDNLVLSYHFGTNGLLRVYYNASEKNNEYTSPVTDEYMRYSVDNQALGGELQQSWRLNDQHTLVAGADWRQTDVDYDSQGIDTSYITKAVYMEDNWKLTDKWTLTGGARYDNHSIIGDYATSRITANRVLNPNTNIYLSWGQFVKAPLVEDLYSNTEYMIGNPDLDPETGDTVTLGVNTRLSWGTQLQSSVFSSRLKDAIGYEYGSITRAVNIDRQKKVGADLTLSHQLTPDWKISGGYSYLRIENKDGDAADYSKDLTNNQPHGYHLKLQYDQMNWDAGLTMRGASGRNLENFTSADYLTVDMTVNYHLDAKTRIFLKGYNLTNEAYEVRGSGGLTAGAHPMPGRSIYLGLGIRL